MFGIGYNGRDGVTGLTGGGNGLGLFIVVDTSFLVIG